PALQDGDRVAAVFEALAVDTCVPVEIAPPAHLRPRRVDAERDDGEGEVDDPDAEVFAGARAEFDGVAFLGTGGVCRRAPLNGRQSHGFPLRIILRYGNPGRPTCPE